MTITEVKELLESHQIRALKSLSQNFFIDEPLLKSVLAEIDCGSSGVLVEIGPGLGSLTQCLLQYHKPIIAFELDKTLAQILLTILNNPSNLTIYHQDILKSEDIFATISEPYTVIANIPYHITGAIIRFLVTQPHPAESINLLIQQEVASTLTSPENTLAKLSLDLYATARVLRKIPKSAFYPRPDVDSTFITITPHRQYTHLDREAVIDIIKIFFQAKRKALGTTLKKHFPNQSLPITIDPNRRPAELTLTEWIEVYKILKGNEKT